MTLQLRLQKVVERALETAVNAVLHELTRILRASPEQAEETAMRIASELRPVALHLLQGQFGGGSISPINTVKRIHEVAGTWVFSPLTRAYASRVAGYNPILTPKELRSLANWACLGDDAVAKEIVWLATRIQVQRDWLDEDADAAADEFLKEKNDAE